MGGFNLFGGEEESYEQDIKKKIDLDKTNL